MGYQVDNAIIMAAGLASRFAPISYEKPKALVEVRGEILIERQICQLLEAGIGEIILVAGYRKEQFYYLRDKYGVIILENKEYLTRNNHSSIYAARDYLKNSYICSSDNYFVENVFEKEVEESYYAALFAEGETNEWCLQTDEQDYIIDVKIGGRNQWYMMGQAFWSKKFSDGFLGILDKIYDEESTKGKLWEDIYRENISKLKMKIKRYKKDSINEFDSLDELRLFDSKYIDNSGSAIMHKISQRLQCREGELVEINPIKNEKGESIGVCFYYDNEKYQYNYKDKSLVKMKKG